MKLYEFTGAPNPRRVRIFLAEKGIKIPLEQVDIAAGKNRAPEFLKINPMGGLPVLELDDGTNLAESVAICRYLEAQQPRHDSGRVPQHQPLLQGPHPAGS
jgi:glutathione S-transferase